MTAETSPKTLDLAAVFSGRAFPKEIVPVYMDEVLGYEIYKLNRDSVEALMARDEKEKERIESSLQELYKKAEPSRLLIHLTGASREDRKAATEEALEKFPAETDMLGRAKPNPKADEFYANLVWKLHVEKIEAADGSVLEPSLEDISIFRTNAPDHAIESVEKGIQELTEGVKGGFTTLIQEHDFLSQR